MTDPPRKKPGPKGPRRAHTAHLVRIEDDVWAKAQTIAKARNETVSEVIRRALANYVHNYRKHLREDQ